MQTLIEPFNQVFAIMIQIKQFHKTKVKHKSTHDKEVKAIQIAGYSKLIVDWVTRKA